MLHKHVLHRNWLCKMQTVSPMTHERFYAAKQRPLGYPLTITVFYSRINQGQHILGKYECNG